MLNRWQGNTGRYIRVEEPSDRPPERPSGSPPPPSAAPVRAYPLRTDPLPGGIRLPAFVSRRLEALENEDILLLLILYLMYKESGDSELLLMMGAMFLT